MRRFSSSYFLSSSLQWPSTQSKQKRCSLSRQATTFWLPGRGPFLKVPGNLTGPKSDFEIKVSRKVGRVVTSNEVRSVSLANNFTV